MKRIIILFIGFIILNALPKVISSPREHGFTFLTASPDNLPLVLTNNFSDLISSKLKFEAALKFRVNQLPGNLLGSTKVTAKDIYHSFNGTDPLDYYPKYEGKPVGILKGAGYLD
jgi:hypothetical protein